MSLFAYHAPTPDLFQPGPVRTTVKLLTRSPKAPGAVWLYTEPDNEAHLRPMRLAATAGGWRVWEADLILNGADAVTHYAFKLLADDAQLWLSAAGASPVQPLLDEHFRYVPDYRPAAWVWDQVFYQIFPDRFCDGDPSNNVVSGAYVYDGHPVVARSWGERPDRRQGAREFFGGDLQGVTLGLPYLERLGVGALYLNPIFTSPSSHKYDTVDYHHVDAHLGGDDAFRELCAELKRRGMRLILDAALNHTSERHPWFDRYGEHVHGAFGSDGSPTRGFYVFGSDHPDGYLGWKGVRTLPVLDYTSTELQQQVYHDEDAILRRWMRPPYAIDGWRFDVIHMLGEGAGASNNAAYVRAFRRTLREENPDAYVLGEHFSEATRWLQGDQEDGAMNYFGFTAPLLAFLAGCDGAGHPVAIDAAGFDAMLTRARAALPHPIQLSQFNLLDSHDTPRFLTRLHGDRELMKVAATALLTYIGVPCIYYGDEIGLEGGHDPDCRRPFPWDETTWDHELLEHYRALCALRRERPALRYGGYLTLHARGDVHAYARLYRGQAIVTVLNRGEATTVDLPVWQAGWALEALGTRPVTQARDLIGGRNHPVEEGRLALQLPARRSQVLELLMEPDSR